MTLRPTALPAFGVFAVAARHQNFANAAEELGLTASAVSHHVRGLEATLGVKLFQRHARGVVLTVEGRSLADAATAALSDSDAGVQSPAITASAWISRQLSNTLAISSSAASTRAAWSSR